MEEQLEFKFVEEGRLLDEQEERSFYKGERTRSTKQFSLIAGATILTQTLLLSYLHISHHYPEYLMVTKEYIKSLF